MAFRTFRNSSGAEWQVYDVYPQLPEERRQAPRRSGGFAAEESEIPADRRVFALEFDRRVSVGKRPSRRIVQPWLCFERGEMRCRLSPIPEDWITATDAQLEAWCKEAKPAARTGLDVGTSSSRG